MNYSGTGWEWMAMPLLALRSDRALFLINTVGFFLLPGLIFSVFRQGVVARRAAWAWACSAWEWASVPLGQRTVLPPSQPP